MNIVGVRFKRASKVYHFDPSGLDLNVNDYVVVETARGLDLGQVVIAPKEVEAAEGSEPLKPVVRKADANDMARAHDLESREKEAMVEGGKLVERLNLPMKLVSADYNLDGSRVTVYFTAEERVDFRELVREMAGRLRTRVELRQVGPRDEAKLVGGYGRCGRQLCCGSFLSELAPVSIKMAKDQGLPLNPLKISGCCGRLMCCLSYECQQYREMRQGLPREGQRVTTATGAGKVVGVNPLVETVMVRLDESEAMAEFPAADVKVEPRVQPPQEKSETRPQ
ncbi:MAG: stage 0 sporulation family protein [Chloroflexi bacterium RBG_16_57_8]|nr:MAG: stage 0 sporulation family protein [Chloroflexi bacterium RBG_16_57_8]